MTDTEKKLLQAQHRLEEAQARDRVKERKARTRRLIQEGAILEKVLPEVQTMELSALEDYLMQKLPQHLRVLLSSSAQVSVVSILETACDLPAQTCHRQLCLRLCPEARLRGIFSFAKEKQKKGIEVNETWQFIIWKRRWSAGAQDAPQWPPPLI